ncbi:MAG: metallophosphoesterase [Alphaproteobacteria bacterium]|nr:metallophosphoesterase [Alphaproteobacteria bacterium]
MVFFFGMLILVVAAIAVTYKTLTGYASFSAVSKILILLILTASWFSPMWLRWIRNGYEILNGTFYDIAYKLGYFMMGFVLILAMLLILRDVLWYVVYFISRIKALNPDNAHAINVANFITVLLALTASFYGVYEAHKSPDVRQINISDNRIKEKVKFVMASDFHINQSTPVWHIQKMIDIINKQNPDYILLVGDIVDDEPERTIEKFKMLEALRAKKIYISLGNHEYYHKPYAWMIEFNNLGFEVLHNTGEKIENTGVYVGGVPDVGSTSVNYDKALANSEDTYKILLSHAPTDFKDIDKTKFDIQLSGHTHGGQIFPFQYITKRANDGYLAGLYETDDADLFVSRGAGYWGPPMRILAEPDIAVLNLEPSK